MLALLQQTPAVDLSCAAFGELRSILAAGSQASTDGLACPAGHLVSFKRYLGSDDLLA